MSKVNPRFKRGDIIRSTIMRLNPRDPTPMLIISVSRAKMQYLLENTQTKLQRWASIQWTDQLFEPFPIYNTSLYQALKES